MKLSTLLLVGLLACDTSHIDLSPGDGAPPATWTIEALGGTADGIGAITAADNVIVALRTAGGVAMAQRGSGEWRIAAPTTADQPHILFSFDATHLVARAGPLVRHATGDGITWTWQDVGLFTRPLALAADGFGNVFALVTTGRGVALAERRDDGRWSHRRLPGVPVVAHASLATSGQRLLAAFPTEDSITLLIREGRTWQREQIPAVNAGEQIILRGTDDGVLWILYQDTVDGALRAMRGEPGAPWRHELIDWGADTGRAPSLRVEADGRAHACYFAGERLRYALREPRASWVISTVGEADPRGGCDLALDASGGVHIAFVRKMEAGGRAFVARADVPSKLALTRRTARDTMPVGRRQVSARDLGTVGGTVGQILLAPDGGSVAVVGDDLALLGTKRGRVRAELPAPLTACRHRAERVTLGLALGESVEELASISGEAERPVLSEDGRHLTVYLGAEVRMPSADAKPPLSDPVTVHRFATIDTAEPGAPHRFELEVRGFTDEPVFTGSGEYVAWVDGTDRSRVVVWSRATRGVTHTLAHPAEVDGVQIVDDHRVACQWTSGDRVLVRTHELVGGDPIWEIETGLPLALLAGTNLGRSSGQVINLEDGAITMTAPEPPEEDGPERLSGLWALAPDGRTAVGPTSEGNWALGNATNARVRRLLDTELDGRFHLGGHTGLQWRFVRRNSRVVAATPDEVGVFDAGRGKLVRALNVGALGSVVAILLAGDDRAVFLRRAEGKTTFSALRFGLDRLRATRDPVALLITAAPWLAATPLAATGQFVPVQAPQAAKPNECLLTLETLALDAACVDDTGARVPKRTGAACPRILAASDDLMFEVTLFDNNALRARAVRAGLKGWVAPTTWLPVQGTATSMALSADGDLVVVGDTDGNLVAGAPRSLEHLRTIERSGRPAACPGVPQTAAVTAVAVAAASPIAAAGYGDGQLFLWNLTSGEQIGEHRFPCDAPTAIAFDAAGATMVAGTSKGHVVHVDIEPL